MIDIVETVYRGASKGRGLVVAPKGGLTGPQKFQRFGLLIDMSFRTRRD